MLTKDDFKKRIADSIAAYPAVAPLYNAGSPIILQHLEAMAGMLTDFSMQLEVAQSEPFEKVRPSTILADAAMRGIIRKGVPARVTITAKNDNATPFVVETGRAVFDSVGNYYLIETAATIPANSTDTFEALQVKVESFNHTVTGNTPFYAIEIPEATDDSFLSGLAVDDAIGGYEYRNRYINSLPDERIYNVEADDRQRVYVRFGQQDIVGTQPSDGTVITVSVYRTKGEIAPAYNSPFSFEYNQTVSDSYVTLKMNALLFGGQNPMFMSAMRDLAKYPSIYQAGNAVFLGEFDFLVRVAFPTVKFLSVWNESEEETARIASVDNINRVFVAVLSLDSTETVLTEPNPASPVAPTIITSLTATQTAIKAHIKNADDSYKVVFYTPVRSEIVTTITAMVSTSYVASEIQSKIREVILAEYGEAAAASKRGANQPLYREIYALLKEKIPALSDGRADLQLTIAAPIGNLRPEMWRYVSPASLTVTVTTANITQNGWGGR